VYSFYRAIERGDPAAALREGDAAADVTQLNYNGCCQAPRMPLAMYVTRLAARHAQLGIQLRRVEVNGESATVQIDLTINGAASPQHLGLRLQDGRWRIAFLSTANFSYA
jgi:hypothetical protein